MSLVEVAPPPPEDPLRKRMFEIGIRRSNGPLPLRLLRAVAWTWFITLLVWQNPRVRGRKVASTAMFWMCQLLRRMGRSYVADLGSDGKVICPPWSALACLTAATGAHEPSEQSFVTSFLREGDGVIDAGANIGLYTIAMASRGAYVAAFEPGDQARAVLTRNVQMNDLSDSVLVCPDALSDFDGEARFTTGLDVQNHLVIGDVSTAGLQLTRVRKLDTFWSENRARFGSRPVALIKIDVEGQDLEVMNGGRDLIDQHRPVLMIETRLGGPETLSLLDSWRYGSFWFHEPSRRLIRFPEGWKGNYQFHTNVIAVPDEKLDQVLERLAHKTGGEWRPPRISLKVPSVSGGLAT